MSMTTLEEVFIGLGTGKDMDRKVTSGEARMNVDSSAKNWKPEVENPENFTIAVGEQKDGHEATSNVEHRVRTSNFTRTWLQLFRKRFTVARRDLKVEVLNMSCFGDALEQNALT